MVKALELARKEARKNILCSIAKYMCQTCRMFRSNLDPEDVAKVCGLVTSLCSLYCEKPSKACMSALEALQEGNERDYIARCNTAVTLCVGGGESVKEKAKTYVT